MSVGQTQVSKDEIFYCRREKDNVEAKGLYQGNGFLLLKDSRLSLQQFSSLYGAKEKVIDQRAYMIREGILVERGGYWFCKAIIGCRVHRVSHLMLC